MTDRTDIDDSIHDGRAPTTWCCSSSRPCPPATRSRCARLHADDRGPGRLPRPAAARGRLGAHRGLAGHARRRRRDGRAGPGDERRRPRGGPAPRVRERSAADLQQTLIAIRRPAARRRGKVTSEPPVDALAAHGAPRSTRREVIILTRPHVVAEFFHVDWTSRARRKLGVPVLHLIEHENFDEQASGSRRGRHRRLVGEVSRGASRGVRRRGGGSRPPPGRPRRARAHAAPSRGRGAAAARSPAARRAPGAPRAWTRPWCGRR